MALLDVALVKLVLGLLLMVRLGFDKVPVIVIACFVETAFVMPASPAAARALPALAHAGTALRRHCSSIAAAISDCSGALCMDWPSNASLQPFSNASRAVRRCSSISAICTSAGTPVMPHRIRVSSSQMASITNSLANFLR
eukprot:CAMPEP_0178369952 /NCGR_PEP_ID=MMETSP0689_2-20121128/45_1 /TAXON_ID=160604 /ORGANISM="Amphidinium massartii, Strain CS-259" /LENGTH=140 /DNA_ID=CAMNT_0019989745 /DNA_START=395 /DNA_END=817 /DNA_ORIENTATION=+